MTNFARSYSTSSRILLATKAPTRRALSCRSTSRSRSKSDRRGAALPKIIGVIVAVALLAGYLAINFFTNERTSEIFAPITATVERGDFVSQVLDQGQIQSSENVEIRCEVRARNGTTTVLNLAPEASTVQALSLIHI